MASNERKQIDSLELNIRQSEESFAAVVNAIRDYAIFLLDAGGIITSWNEGARSIKGYEASEIIGKHFSIFYTEFDRRRNHPAYELDVAQRDGVYEEEGWRVRKDGSTLWTSVNITAVFDDAKNIRGFVKVTRDLTERRKQEEELEKARDEAILANNFKSQFIANVSHEIRTPMAGVICMAEQLVTDDTLNEDQREAAEHVFLSSTRLLEVLNDLLDFSKLEAGRVSLDETSFTLASIIKEVGDSVCAAAKKKGLAVNVSIDPSIPQNLIGDEAKIRQSLLNLAHNAVKFTRQGQVDISVSLVEPGEILQVRFDVRDTGIGIRSDLRELLFEPFVQADGTTRRRFGGTGLGLSICKRFIEVMAGQVGFESEEGSGAHFWFIVPLRPV